jgi:hypothetical protein
MTDPSAADYTEDSEKPSVKIFIAGIDERTPFKSGLARSFEPGAAADGFVHCAKGKWRVIERLSRGRKLVVELFCETSLMGTSKPAVLVTLKTSKPYFMVRRFGDGDGFYQRNVGDP